MKLANRAALIEVYGPALVEACECSQAQAAWVPRGALGVPVTWDWLYMLDWGETMGQCVPQADGMWLARPFPYKMDKAFLTLPEAMTYVERHGSR